MNTVTESYNLNIVCMSLVIFDEYKKIEGLTKQIKVATMRPMRRAIQNQQFHRHPNMKRYTLGKKYARY